MEIPSATPATPWGHVSSFPSGGNGRVPQVSFSRQMRTMMWKNTTLLKRNYRDLAREVVWPIILMTVMLIMRNAIPSGNMPEVLDHDNRWDFAPQGGLYFIAPCSASGPCTRPGTAGTVCDFATTALRNVISGSQYVCKRCDMEGPGCTGSDSIQGTYAMLNSTLMQEVSGIAFDVPAQLTDKTIGFDGVTYRIRLNPQWMGGIGLYNTSATWKTGPDSTPDTLFNSFVPLQQAVDAAIANFKNAYVRQFDVSYKPFPTAAYVINYAQNALGNVLPIYLTLIFSLQVRVTLAAILVEKEKRIKEGMRMVGLTDAAYWLSWFAYAMSKGLIVCLGVTILAKVGKLFEYSDPSLVFVILVSFGFCCVSFCFMASTVFSKSRTGGAVGMLFWIVLSTPSYALTGSSVGPAGRTVLCIFAPLCFNEGMRVLSGGEATQLGVQWADLGNAQLTDSNIAMGAVLGMLLLDAVLYGMFAWYLDKVVPSEFGTPLPPTFCCKRGYWSGQRRHAHSEAAPLLETPAGGATELNGGAPEVAVEPAPASLAGLDTVRLLGLSKTFDTKDGPKVALKDLRLAMYEGQITALLGHNGAGKTTTISMLTGLFPCTSGDAAIYGRCISDDMQGVRELIGVCPQHDVLFDQLTTEEHLRLYAGIKGVPLEHVDATISELIADVGLEEKRHSNATTLSGGQKRRLSVALAFMGDARCIFLDEPTSGMDPAARRQMWTLLQRKKAGRVIVLTTHFMDEADILGDRIAILAKGKLRVVGSSMFLKSRFGIGYHLTMSTKANSQVHSIESAIKVHVPSAMLEVDAIAVAAAAAGSLASTEVSFTLPLRTARSFPALFDDLEKQAAVLGIEAFGVSVTSLEEVFLRLANDVEHESQDAQGGGVGASHESTLTDLRTLGVRQNSNPHMARQLSGAADGPGIDIPTAKESASAPIVELNDLFIPTDSISLKPASFVQQFRAQIWRMFRQARRDKRAVFLQTFFPVLFIIVSIAFRGLQNINNAAPLTTFSMTPQQWTGLPQQLSLLYAVVPSRDPHDPVVAPVLNRLPTASTLPGMTSSPVFVSAPDITSFEQALVSANYASLGLFFDTTPGFLGLPQVTVFYNTSQTNGPAIWTAILDGALLADALNVSAATPTVWWEPFPRQASNGPNLGQFLSSMLTGFYISMGFCVIPALAAANVVKERECKAKLQQFLMGSSAHSYWLSRWCWDGLQYLVAWALACIVVGAMADPVFTAAANFPTIMLLLFSYGVSVNGVAYMASFLFDKHSVAQTWIMVTFYLLTTVEFFAMFIIQFPGLNIMSTDGANALQYFFYLLPSFCVAKGFADIAMKCTCVFSFGAPCTPLAAYAWDAAGGKIAFMLGSVPVWFTVIMLVEYFSGPRSGRVLTCANTEAPVGGGEIEDADVAAERARVTTEGCKDNIKLVGLRKVFPGTGGCQPATPPKVAVQDLSIGIAAGECFGLLGPNGAGKSTTMSIMCGEVTPSDGRVTLAGDDVTVARERIYRIMGYCPQFDALFDLLTGEETLRFYGRIKGIPEPMLSRAVDSAIVRMDLAPYRNVLTHTYSGGNKRKLSLAVSYMGAPRVVFLDEPSTGMDPGARHKMWDVVSSSRRGRTVVLTTHLMAEADELCTRIGIMICGRLACVGTSQHLKSRYGQGYQIEIKATASSMDLSRLVESLSSDVRKLDEHVGYVKYELGVAIRLSAIFSVLENARDALGISDYIVSQTTLEQVFLNFAKRQEEMDNAARSGGMDGAVH